MRVQTLEVSGNASDYAQTAVSDNEYGVQAAILAMCICYIAQMQQETVRLPVPQEPERRPVEDKSEKVKTLMELGFNSHPEVIAYSERMREEGRINNGGLNVNKSNMLIAVIAMAVLWIGITTLFVMSALEEGPVKALIFVLPMLPTAICCLCLGIWCFKKKKIEIH